jgi:hypothetical protein
MIAAALITGQVLLYQLNIDSILAAPTESTLTILPSTSSISMSTNSSSSLPLSSSNSSSSNNGNDDNGTIGGVAVRHSHRLVHTLNHHRSSCRSLQFSADGLYLYSTGSDRSICMIDINTGTVISRISDAHPQAINVMRLYDTNGIATGDDEGGIALWDLRLPSQRTLAHRTKAEKKAAATAASLPKASKGKSQGKGKKGGKISDGNGNGSGIDSRVMREKEPYKCWYTLEQADFISEIVCVPSHHRILASSGDSTMCVYDARNGKVYAMADPLEDELLSLTIAKGGGKVCGGTREGAVNIWTWDMFGQAGTSTPSLPHWSS